MDRLAKTYTVRQLARLAGVSVRTLHHYDQIGLLKPQARSAARYRLYAEGDLLRLQQILFFKELQVPLDEIRQMLDGADFDAVAALKNHRRLLHAEAQRLAQLINTIDKTIEKLTEVNMELTDEELYEGFSREEIERYRREARQRYDPKLVEESEKRARKMSKAQWQALKEEGEQIYQEMASLMGRAPDDAQVQQVIAHHHAMIEHFYTAPAELYAGLGRLYIEDPEFRAFFERYAPGLADFMQAAMMVYSAKLA
ncbi:MAG: MerR family transcriptional regulator [Chloroflexota bacterium]